MRLEVKNICKTFPGVRALRGVSLDIHPGEVHAILGENGAGKSTLMNILIGALKPDDGQIFIDDVPVTFHNPMDALRLGVGMVPQEINLVPTLTVAENVYLGIEPRIGGVLIDRRRIRDLTSDAIALIGESFDPDARISDLSTAEKQLVQIARAFAFGAKLLILDEPTASLTVRESRNLFKIVRSHQASGGSVFYISHRLEEIKEIATRITVLRDGTKTADLEVSGSSISDMIVHMVAKKATKATRIPCSNEAPVVLQVQNLTRNGEFSNISFDLHKGEILGIAGLIGSGRTEIMKCIIGDTRPQKGEVLLEGIRINCRSPRQAIHRGIAYLPEERRRLGIFPVLSVRENLTLPMLPRFMGSLGINQKKTTQAAQEYVSRLKVKTFGLNQEIRNLSGGNQQKVILARWLLRGCKVLILDEPTRGVDINAKIEIHNIIREITSEGISVILISSELEEILDNTDRTLILHEGRLKGQVLSTATTQEEIMKLCLT